MGHAPTTQDAPPPPGLPRALAAGGGEMGERIRRHDWAASTLGPIQDWPAPLRTLVSVMMAANQPMFLAWGTQRTMLYNDGYAPILADRHPSALGRPFLEVWHEIRDELQPIVDNAFLGVPTQMDDIELQMLRQGRLEEAHFSFFYAPVVGDDGEIAGMFCACQETTAQVMAARKSAEQTRRERELFERAPGFIAVLQGPEHRFEFANAAYRRVTGERPLLGRTVTEAFPEAAEQGFIDVLDRVYRSGEPFFAENLPVQLRAGADGPLRQTYLNFVYQPIRDEHGEITGIFVEGSDVSEAHRVRDALTQAHARYASVLGAMGEGFVLFDAQYRMVEINAEGERLIARKRPTILGRSQWELWPESRGTAIEEAYRRVMERREHVQLEVRLNGRWLGVRMFPVQDGVACFFRDITDLKTADALLRDSEARFRAAVAAIGVLWTNDREGRMTGEQPGWSALTGQTQAEYEGYGWARVVHPEDAQPTIDGWNRAVASESTFDFEHRVRRHDGQWRHFAIRAVPVRDGRGRIREWVGVHVDITEQREAAAERETLLARERAARAEAEVASRAKDEFLAMLGHELRNPLAPIVTALHLMQLRGGGHAPEREIIERQVRHMTRLVDDLLDVSLITSGRIELKREHVDLEEIVSAAAEMTAPLIQQRNHRLRLDLGEAAVEGDRVRLAQVVSNLLTNAARYTPDGGEIELSVEREDDEAVLRVRDNGIGIEPELLERSFELFVQGKQALDRARGGLGLGLAIVRSLVRLHGGEVTAQSAGRGAGSVFTVRLPAAPRQPLHRQAPALAAAQARLRARVLVVDDNRDAAALIAKSLRAVGHHVDLAYDGPGALAQAAETAPQIVVLDLGLPQLDGWEVARRLRADPALGRVPIIAVTGYGQARDREQSRAAGIDAHLVKPADPAQLLLRIEQLLDAAARR